MFVGVRGNAVQDIPVPAVGGCGQRRSSIKVKILHLSTPHVHAGVAGAVPVAGLCGPGVTCFPVGLPSVAGGQVYLSWLYPPYVHVCDDHLSFDPLDRSIWL